MNTFNTLAVSLGTIAAVIALSATSASAAPITSKTTIYKDLNGQTVGVEHKKIRPGKHIAVKKAPKHVFGPRRAPTGGSQLRVGTAAPRYGRLARAQRLTLKRLQRATLTMKRLQRRAFADGALTRNELRRLNTQQQSAFGRPVT